MQYAFLAGSMTTLSWNLVVFTIWWYVGEQHMVFTYIHFHGYFTHAVLITLSLYMSSIAKKFETISKQRSVLQGEIKLSINIMLLH